MAKLANQRQSSGQTTRQRATKFLLGAGAGALIGAIAIQSDFEITLMMLAVLAVIAGYVYFVTHQSKFGSKSWAPKSFSPTVVVGILIIGAVAVGGLKYLGSSFAWHPQGVIKKSVQNVTTNTPLFDAEYGTAAPSVKPGDILNYVIVISDVAPNAVNHYNDMAFTVMTDTLPAGVELVSDPTKRTITENIGTILPGKSVTKTYQVKVVSSTDGALIENKACFTADSVVKDNPQKGCDVAVTKTVIPVTPTPTPTPPPTTPPPTTPPPTTPPPTTPPPTTPPPTTPPPTTPPPTTPPPTTPPPTTPPPTPQPTPPSETPPPATPPPTTPPPTTPPPAPTIITLPQKLPSVGGSNILIVAAIAVLAGYLLSAIYGISKSKAAKR